MGAIVGNNHPVILDYGRFLHIMSVCRRDWKVNWSMRMGADWALQ
jgi:hypothetical protein